MHEAICANDTGVAVQLTDASSGYVSMYYYLWLHSATPTPSPSPTGSNNNHTQFLTLVTFPTTSSPFTPSLLSPSPISHVTSPLTLSHFSAFTPHPTLPVSVRITFSLTLSTTSHVTSHSSPLTPHTSLLTPPLSHSPPHITSQLPHTHTTTSTTSHTSPTSSPLTLSTSSHITGSATTSSLHPSLSPTNNKTFRPLVSHHCVYYVNSFLDKLDCTCKHILISCNVCIILTGIH